MEPFSGKDKDKGTPEIKHRSFISKFRKNSQSKNHDINDERQTDSSSSKSDSSQASLSKTKVTNFVPVFSAEEFLDSLSLSSSSTMSDIQLSDDEDILNSEGHRASFFIDSSRVSLSSDDEEDHLPSQSPSLLEFNLSDGSHSFDDADLYNDWDFGLSHSSVEIQREETQSWTNTSVDAPDLEIGRIDFPHRALRFMECEICLEMSYLRRRVCCDYKSCNKCLSMYLTGKVKEGKVQIECLNDRCNILMCKSEIRHRLTIEMREKFEKFLIDANTDPHKKTCPSCSLPSEIDPARLKVSKKKLNKGVEVTCSQCRLVWCFRCHAPFHSNMTCKKYKNENEMVKRWAKEFSYGQVNAQKCPKCKILVQKMDGCDHMKCTQCDTNFCYRCGDRYISVKFFGSHWNRFSLFGCKYRLMPDKKGLRMLIRGSHFLGKVLGAVVFGALGVVAGAFIVAGSVVILPGYVIVRLRRRMWAAKQRKKFHKRKMRMIDMAAKTRAQMERHFQGGNLETVVEESETETSEPVSDLQQVQVMVHHSEGQEEISTTKETEDCDVYVNIYTGDDPQTEQSEAGVSEGGSVEDDPDNSALSDSKELNVEGKYTKRVLNIISCIEKGRKKSEDEALKDADNGSSEGKNAKKEVCNVVEGDVVDTKCDAGVEEVKKEVTVDANNKPDEYGLQLLKDMMEKDNDVIILSSVHKVEGEFENLEVKSLSHEQSPCVVRRRHSLSKLKTQFDEKIMRSRVFKDIDKVNGVEKSDGETAHKGCFRNIFNVTKRNAGVPAITNHEEDVSRLEKSNKPKQISSLATTKAATWEKCRSSHVEIDPMLKSSNDSVLDETEFNVCPLPCHKSRLSLSSIIGLGPGGESSGVKNEVILLDENGVITVAKIGENGKEKNPLGGCNDVPGVIGSDQICVGDDSSQNCPGDREVVSQISVMTHL